MSNPSKVLGVMKPIGGGDPVPLDRERIVIGRRASSDVCLDFENVSGKHCELHFFHGLWHIRDLGSKNGTTVNGLKVGAEQSVLPDVEIGIASHFFTIDYEPAGPPSRSNAPRSTRPISTTRCRTTSPRPSPPRWPRPRTTTSSI